MERSDRFTTTTPIGDSCAGVHPHERLAFVDHPAPPFASAAEAMAAAGLAVLPLRRDRKPLVDGFNKWRYPPCRDTVAHWTVRYPDANVGIVPALSGVIVVDSDDIDEDARVEALFGTTPLTVRTNRGRHRYYRRVDVRLPGNLKRFGLNVDIKQGNSIVIAPPSIHESGKLYTLEGADWSALKDLPPLELARLRELIEPPPIKVKPKQAALIDGMRDGSRGLWLNDQLCSKLRRGGCADFNALLNVARTLNASLPVPLDEAEVVWRTKQAWRDFEAGKIRPKATDELWRVRGGRSALTLIGEAARAARAARRVRHHA